VFENRVLRTFGHKREEVTRDWKRLYNDGFISCTLYLLLLRWRTRWAEYIASMEEKRMSYKILVGKTSLRVSFGSQNKKPVFSQTF
jgi:hypothetical protein